MHLPVRTHSSIKGSSQIFSLQFQERLYKHQADNSMSFGLQTEDVRAKKLSLKELEDHPQKDRSRKERGDGLTVTRPCWK